MLIRIGLAMLLPLVLVLSIATSSTYRLVREGSDRYVEEVGSHYADLLSNELRFRHGQIETMASVFVTYRMLPVEDRRDIVATAIRSVLEASPDLLGAWSLWEPGAMGDSAERDYPLIRGDPRIGEDGSVIAGAAGDAGDPSMRGSRGAFYASWYWNDGTIRAAGIAPEGMEGGVLRAGQGTRRGRADRSV
ncbi:MAG TPA: hypothetical protein P5298_03300 [Spirochaetia bacterium]|nr:hypothetical protein [Spirochaetaceae bacterium]HPE88378.1 hypothetical protein [Spirochaetales bacterium]HRW23413.1 hypothetical protein [Spirochaetia bacterium]